jgi:hypothetical protein
MGRAGWQPLGGSSGAAAGEFRPAHFGGVGIEKPADKPDVAADTSSPEADPRTAMALLAAHEEERSRLAEGLRRAGPGVRQRHLQTACRACAAQAGAAHAELAALRAMLERELDTARLHQPAAPVTGRAAGPE